MQWFKNLSITKKIMSGFVLIATISGICGAFAVFEIHRISHETESMFLYNTEPLQYIGDIGVKFERIRVNLRDMYSEKDIGARKEHLKTVRSLDAGIDEDMKAFEQSLHNEKTKEQYVRLTKELRDFRLFQENVISLALSGKDDEGHKLVKEQCRVKARKVEDDINSMFVLKIELAKDKYIDSVKASKMTIIVSTILTIINTIAAIALGIFVSITIKRPIISMRDILKDIAEGEGDLTKRLVTTSQDEIGETCIWFNTFIDKLHSIISEVSGNTNQVASAANQLQATAIQIATGTEEVAAQTSTVATATEEMSATSSDIAHSCQKAADGATNASKTAQAGADVVDGTIRDMLNVATTVKNTANIITMLGERGESIGEIIDTITDIADQTNLLALNAAIEAARAGEQGRGFAVVADEVRKLAEQTTTAAKQIGTMIKTIQKETESAVVAMDAGVKEVESVSNEAIKSREALQNIMQQINDLTMQVAQIATASEEQTATTHEISGNICQITEVVHGTASSSQETATAAHQLAGLAEQLHSLVRQFKL